MEKKKKKPEIRRRVQFEDVINECGFESDVSFWWRDALKDT